MQEMINFIVNNGIGVVCVAYLIYFQNTTMNKMLKALNDIDKTLIIIGSKLGVNIKTLKEGGE